MMKFKIGDKVVIQPGAVGSASEYVGKTGTIVGGFASGFGGDVRMPDGEVFYCYRGEVRRIEDVLKFKIGDRVQLKKGLKNIHYKMENSDIGDTYIPGKMSFSGFKTVVATENGKYRLQGCDPWNYTDGMLEPYGGCNAKIVITTDGKVTLARIYGDDGKVTRSASAICSESDTFDFEAGARIAFDRLLPDHNAKEPAWYTGDAVCIAIHDRNLISRDMTVGKIYKIEDGFWSDDSGFRVRRDCRLSTGNMRKLGIEFYPVPDGGVFNGKVIAVSKIPAFAQVSDITIGKIYNITNGIGFSDDGRLLPGPGCLISKMSDLNCNGYKFIEVKE